MTLDASFKNPFADYNANVMDSSMILRYWCSPFSFKKSKFSEAEVYSDPMPIAFMGGRGSGKTMFLKYWSYEVQRDRAIAEKGGGERTILPFLRRQGGIGIYLRIDGPELRTFTGRGVLDETWEVIFVHFFELSVCRSYLEVLADLVGRRELDEEVLEGSLLPKFRKLLGEHGSTLETLQGAIEHVDGLLTEVHDYRSKILLAERTFQPSKVFESKSLSVKVAQLILEVVPGFEEIPFVILVDEYENFLVYQQKTINTMVKFATSEVRLRLGMRLEGFRTYDTVSEREFIKENRDYRKVVFDEFMIRTERQYRDFLLNVARRRLESVPEFQNAGVIDLKEILGDSEDLEAEARKLTSGRKAKHFRLLAKYVLEEEFADTCSTLSHPENRLLEMLNIVRIVRGESPDAVATAMNQYVRGEPTEAADKYRMDYVDKYKLSLMFLLASLYKKDKLYYSFNTFCFLSSGIVGHFIELCRRCIQIAYFEARSDLIDHGTIAPEIQNRAARIVARSELEMVRRISEHGDELSMLIRNLGNIFRAYHTDERLRYPETNQVAIDRSSLPPELQDILQSAIEWSILQEKPVLQGAAPSSDRRDLYTLNRIFSPLFEVSYRTRGGYSEEYDSEEFGRLVTQSDVPPKLAPNKPPKQKQRKFF